jgi:outer membrane protein TolC
LLRALLNSDDPGGELSKTILSSVNPVLGTKAATNPFIGLVAPLMKNPTVGESKTERQIAGLLASRERQADAEVRAAVATLRGNRASVAAKGAEVRNLTAKVADLKKRADAGVAGAEVEYTLARLDLLKLRGELVQAVADWHQADVKLRQAMGLLVRE